MIMWRKPKCNWEVARPISASRVEIEVTYDASTHARWRRRKNVREPPIAKARQERSEVASVKRSSVAVRYHSNPKEIR